MIRFKVNAQIDLLHRYFFRCKQGTSPHFLATLTLFFCHRIYRRRTESHYAILCWRNELQTSVSTPEQNGEDTLHLAARIQEVQVCSIGSCATLLFLTVDVDGIFPYPKTQQLWLPSLYKIGMLGSGRTDNLDAYALGEDSERRKEKTQKRTKPHATPPSSASFTCLCRASRECGAGDGAFEERY